MALLTAGQALRWRLLGAAKVGLFLGVDPLRGAGAALLVWLVTGSRQDVSGEGRRSARGVSTCATSSPSVLPTRTPISNGKSVRGGSSTWPRPSGGWPVPAR